MCGVGCILNLGLISISLLFLFALGDLGCFLDCCLLFGFCVVVLVGCFVVVDLVDLCFVSLVYVCCLIC